MEIHRDNKSPFEKYDLQGYGWEWWLRSFWKDECTKSMFIASWAGCTALSSSSMDFDKKYRYEFRKEDPAMSLGISCCMKL